eukprot:6174130-Pleurochrysis_carterae.AAC.1
MTVAEAAIQPIKLFVRERQHTFYSHVFCTQSNIQEETMPSSLLLLLPCEHSQAKETERRSKRPKANGKTAGLSRALANELRKIFYAGGGGIDDDARH